MEFYSSSVTGVFRLVLILLLIYFGMRLLGRFFAPRSRGSAGRRRGRPSHSRRERPDHRQEGEVRIEYTDREKRKNRNRDASDGEYVDYEELN